MPIPSLPIATAPLSPTQAPTPVASQGGATQTLESLQAQLAEQAQQLGVLQAQRRVVQGQLNTTAPGPASTALDAQVQKLDEQIRRLQVDMAGTRAQFAGRLGIPTERIGANGRLTLQNPPDFFPRRGPDPDAVVGLSFALAIAIALPLSIAYARRIWRGKTTTASAQADSVAPRLDRLEQAVDAIAIEIERIAEGQRFVTKVLADRPVVVAPQAPAESPVMREASSSLGQEKPFLALGAGPIEPIRVAERQAVRQSITPH